MPQPEAGEVTAALERVLARPEFTERTLGPIRQALVDGWRSLVAWFSALFADVDLFDGWSPLAVRVLLVVLLAVAAASALYLIWEVVRPVAGWRPVRREGREEGGTGGGEADPDWEEVARRAEAEGRYRDAALALYQATLQRLAARGTVRLVVGKTPGDYRREVARDPTVARPFDVMVRLFLPIAFGAATPDAMACRTLRAAAVEVGGDA